MSSAQDEAVQDASHVLAYRERAHTTQVMMALLLRPTRAAANVLRNLRGTLLVRRQLRNVKDVVVNNRTGRLVTRSAASSLQRSNNNRDEGNVTEVTLEEDVPCKLCLLDPSVVQGVAAQKFTANNTTHTTPSITLTSNGVLCASEEKPLRWVNITDEGGLEAEVGGVAPEVGRRLRQLCATRTKSQSNTLDEKEVQVALIPYEVEMTYRQYTMPELLRLALEPSIDTCYSEDACAESTSELTLLSGFEQIGHIAHLNLSQAHLPYRYMIGAILLDCNPTVSVVVNKVAAIATVFREFKMELIARRANCIAEANTSNLTSNKKNTTGRNKDNEACVSSSAAEQMDDNEEEERVACNGKEQSDADRIVWAETLPEATLNALLTATVKQDGCIFHVPYNRVYWNSRLSQEHRRLVQQIQRHDVLFDVMAGVGPFVIPAAKRGVRVFANDLNPVAAEAMKINIKLNRLPLGLVQVHNMDGRDFLNRVVRSHVAALVQREATSLGTMRYHVVMNLPAIAVTFLDVFAPSNTTTTNETSLGKEQSTSSEAQEDTWRSAPVVLPSAAHERVLLLHVYCFSAEADVLQDARRQVEHYLGYTLPDTCVEGLHMVRDVSPHKRMVCVSFTLPPAFWHTTHNIVHEEKGDTENETCDVPCKRQKVE